MNALLWTLCLFVALASATYNLTQFGLAQFGALTNTSSRRPGPSFSAPLLGDISFPPAFFGSFTGGQQQPLRSPMLPLSPLTPLSFLQPTQQEESKQKQISSLSEPTIEKGEQQQEQQKVGLARSTDRSQTAESLILASGYSYEVHESVSDDGYITKPIRLINPKLQKHTKQLPVVIYGGQFATPALFVLGRQQRPARWPLIFMPKRDMLNRSLAFALSDHGYDVWLVPARGVDRNNRARLGPKQMKWLESMSTSWDESPLTTPNYWDFGIDEIIQFEFQHQLELVLRITDHERLSLITYSSGATVAFGFAASHREYSVAHIDSLVAIAPAVYSSTNNNLLLTAQSLYGSIVSTHVGQNDHFVDAFARNGLNSMCGSFLQPVCRVAFEKMFGPSEMFQSYMESRLLDSVARPQSARSIQHQSQTSRTHEFRHFDYGAYRNKKLYRQEVAPRYALDRIEIPRIFLFSGDKDRIADNDATEKLKHELDDRVGLVILKGYNHLDLIAAWDVDARLNQPIVKLLDSRNAALSGVSPEEHHAVEGVITNSVAPAAAKLTPTKTKSGSPRLESPKKL